RSSCRCLKIAHDRPADPNRRPCPERSSYLQSVPQQEIWTIGHSTLSIEAFMEMLRSFRIEMLVDVRRYPGSRRYPQFNSETFATSLREGGIAYEHMEVLGGRRKPAPDSPNTAWRMAQFRGYADHMSSAEFKEAIENLKRL